MTEAVYRPFKLLCRACKDARAEWAKQTKGGWYYPVTPPPVACPACVDRCEAARFTLAAQGDDPIMEIEFIDPADGLTKTTNVLRAGSWMHMDFEQED